MPSDPNSQEGESQSSSQSVMEAIWKKAKAKRHSILTWALAALVALLLLSAVFDVRVKPGGESEAGNPNFPAGGPAEFMYLDSGRVAAYLAQVNGGSFNAETVRRKLSETLSGKLALEGVVGAAGKESSESSVEREVRPTDASNFFALHAGLEVEDDLQPIRLGHFKDDVADLDEGQFVSFKTTALLSPLYLDPYLAVRQFHTLMSMFPRSTERRAAAKAFLREIGKNPRVVFALQPTDPSDPSGERKPFTYVLPLSASELTRERSLLKYGGGQFTVVGKIVRIFPEKRNDHRPAYIDSPTRETWEEPLRRAPGELICRTEPRCIKEVREVQAEGTARKRAIREARTRVLAALTEQTMIERDGAVILPVAIYK